MTDDFPPLIIKKILPERVLRLINAFSLRKIKHRKKQTERQTERQTNKLLECIVQIFW